MMAAKNIGTLELNIKVKFSVWDAIKIRIAGKHYAKLIDEIVKRIQGESNE